MTINLMDIAPVSKIVDTSHGQVEVDAINSITMCQLLQKHPEIMSMFTGDAPNNDVCDWMALGGEVVVSIVAVALNHNPTDEKVRGKCKLFTPKDTLKILEGFIEKSFPDGVMDFSSCLQEVMQKTMGGKLQDLALEGQAKKQTS